MFYDDHNGFFFFYTKNESIILSCILEELNSSIKIGDRPISYIWKLNEILYKNQKLLFHTVEDMTDLEAFNEHLYLLMNMDNISADQRCFMAPFKYIHDHVLSTFSVYNKNKENNRFFNLLKESYLKLSSEEERYIYPIIDQNIRAYFYYYIQPYIIKESFKNQVPNISVLNGLVTSVIKFKYNNLSDSLKQNYTLLYHGTSIKNLFSIYRHGLVITRSTLKQANGAMYGTGIYASTNFNVAYYFCNKEYSDRKLVVCFYAPKATIMNVTSNGSTYSIVTDDEYIVLDSFIIISNKHLTPHGSVRRSKYLFYLYTFIAFLIAYLTFLPIVERNN
ncbi:hypothetical protein WA158_003827 [Blastocystis sp. Blastoise]